MATISTLAVSLIARTSSFERGMKRSRSSLNRFQQTAGRARARIASLAKGLLVAAGIGGMGFMIKQTMSMIDATAKLSDRLGITTERLIGLRHAANIAGVANEALDKGLSMFVRRLGEVKLGTGEAKEGLKLLGLSADELIRKSPADAVAMVAEKIRLLENASLKGQAAYLLFGRAGQQLLNLFETGAAGMAEMQDEAERLGLTFNRIDAAKIEAANDAVARLKGAMSGLVNVAVIKLATWIERLANFMVKYRDTIVSTIASTVKWVAKTWIAIKVIKTIGPLIRGLIGIYKGLIAAKVFLAGVSGPAAWAALAVGITIATGTIIGLNEAIDKTGGKIKSAIAAAGGIEKAAVKLPTDSMAILAKIAEEKKLLAVSRALDKETPGLKLKITIDAEKRLNALMIALTRARVAEQLQLTKENVAKQLAAREKLEKTALGGLSSFLATAKNRLEDMELGSLAGSFARLERAGAGLAGPALDEYTKKLEKVKGIITEITKQGAHAKWKQDLIAGAKQLAESLKSPADKLKDIAARYNEMLKAGLITAGQLDKAMIKAKGAISGEGIINTGQFRQIRSAFIDIAALAGDVKDKSITSPLENYIRQLAALDIRVGGVENKILQAVDAKTKLFEGGAIGKGFQKLTDIADHLKKSLTTAGARLIDIRGRFGEMSLDRGRFQEMAAATVDVSAMGGAGDITRQILDRQLEEAQKITALLERLAQTDTGEVLI